MARPGIVRIYGNSDNQAREHIAEYLKVPPEEIWPDLHLKLEPKVPLEELFSKNPDLQALPGFGGFTKPFDADPTRSED